MENRTIENKENVEIFNYIARSRGKKKSDKPIIRKILIALLIFMGAIVLFDKAMGGKSILSGSNLVVIFLMILAIINLKPKDSYISAPVLVEFHLSEFVIFYESIDRDDKSGKKSEKTIFKYSNIKKLQYSNSLCTLIIEGSPIEIIKSLKTQNSNEVINDYSQREQIKETQLYINGEYKNNILTKLKLRTGLSVEELE